MGRLTFPIGRSAYALWLLLLAHGAAIAVLWVLPLELWIKALIAVAVVASAASLTRRVALLATQDAVVAVEITEDARLAVKTRRGDWCACRLSGSSYVSPWLTILVLAEDNRRSARYVVITPDNVDAEDFRRLRVWLRWAAQRVAEPG